MEQEIQNCRRLTYETTKRIDKSGTACSEDDMASSDGMDIRNYGVFDGIPETAKLFALGVKIVSVDKILKTM